jgi:hypothetical protein
MNNVIASLYASCSSFPERDIYIPFKGGAVLKKNGRKTTAIDYHNEYDLSRFFLIWIAKIAPLRREVGGAPKHHGRFPFSFEFETPCRDDDVNQRGRSVGF